MAALTRADTSYTTTGGTAFAPNQSTLQKCPMLCQILGSSSRKLASVFKANTHPRFLTCPSLAAGYWLGSSPSGGPSANWLGAPAVTRPQSAAGSAVAARSTRM